MRSDVLLFHFGISNFGVEISKYNDQRMFYLLSVFVGRALYWTGVYRGTYGVKEVLVRVVRMGGGGGMTLEDFEAARWSAEVKEG